MPIHQTDRSVPEQLSVLIHDSLEKMPTRRKPMSWVVSQLEELMTRMPMPAHA
jgi:hypothetical protein